tara:strand:- start:30 stop:269 length:240 start_codon:yes stop_codon:yes gene_type:complete
MEAQYDNCEKAAIGALRSFHAASGVSTNQDYEIHEMIQEDASYIVSYSSGRFEILYLAEVLVSESGSTCFGVEINLPHQ